MAKTSTSLNDLMTGFKNSFLFRGKTATRLGGKRVKKLQESLAAVDSRESKKEDGAHLSGSREWNDGKAEWYEVVPSISYRKPDGTLMQYDFILISRVDGKTCAYGSGCGGEVWNPAESKLISKKGDVSSEDIFDILGYKIGEESSTVVHTKESGAESVESYEKYEDEENDEDSETPESETPESETPEGETGTPEPHETKTPEAEETESPEPESKDEDDED